MESYKLSELYLYGKLLYTVIVEKIANYRFSTARTGMVKNRVITPWRLWYLTTETLRSAIVSCFPCREQYKSNAEKNMTERPRKRKLQTLSKAIFELIDVCRERGHSLV